MFEDQTYENIMARKLAQVPNSLDKREGSLCWNFLYPTAIEDANLYVQLDFLLNASFAATASREYLVIRAAEHGINVFLATQAVVRGVFNIDVPEGAVFGIGGINYVAFENISQGQWKLKCESYGSLGNIESGDLVPVEYIDGLTTAKIDGILVPGEDTEGTEELRKRYFESFSSIAYGGNVADYRQKVRQIDGVGACQVYPVWNGPGTVKIVIIGSDFKPPPPELVSQVQTLLDPAENHGEGLGIAPIGHLVTVVGVESLQIDITFKLSFQQGYSWETTKDAIVAGISEYLLNLAKGWPDSGGIIVRISGINTAVLGVSGVLDVSGTTINGNENNLGLEEDITAKLGSVSAI